MNHQGEVTHQDTFRRRWNAALHYAAVTRNQRSLDWEDNAEAASEQAEVAAGAKLGKPKGLLLNAAASLATRITMGEVKSYEESQRNMRAAKRRTTEHARYAIEELGADLSPLTEQGFQIQKTEDSRANYVHIGVPLGDSEQVISVDAAPPLRAQDHLDKIDSYLQSVFAAAEVEDDQFLDR